MAIKLSKEIWFRPAVASELSSGIPKLRKLPVRISYAHY